MMHLEMNGVDTEWIQSDTPVVILSRNHICPFVMLFTPAILHYLCLTNCSLLVLSAHLKSQVA